MFYDRSNKEIVTEPMVSASTTQVFDTMIKQLL